MNDGRQYLDNAIFAGFSGSGTSYPLSAIPFKDTLMSIAESGVRYPLLFME